MEYALWVTLKYGVVSSLQGLNPYSNGICSLRIEENKA